MHGPTRGASSWDVHEATGSALRPGGAWSRIAAAVSSIEAGIRGSHARPAPGWSGPSTAAPLLAELHDVAAQATLGTHPRPQRARGKALRYSPRRAGTR